MKITVDREDLIHDILVDMNKDEQPNTELSEKGQELQSPQYCSYNFLCHDN